MSQVDDIKSRLDIVDVISEYIALKPAGTNFRALCPFHSEKTPSFMVSRERQLWHCFGCNVGGDLFSFVMKMEGMDFPEALKILANKAGVILENENYALQGEKNRLTSLIELAAKFWHKVFLLSPQAASAREYLSKRGVTKDSLEEFMIGFAPNSWDETLKFLKEKKFSDDEIFSAGLTVRKERGSGFYDRFRNRIIFPIRDTHAILAGFGGRAMPGEEKQAKYINSPQTKIYNKSRIIYNLDKARSYIKEKSAAVFVEGYMDVISSWQAGVKNVVAISGTALTPDHLKIIQRYTNTLLMALDADTAGENAAFRGTDLILGTDLNLRIIRIPLGKDPDECIQKDPAQWRSATESAVPFMEYMLEKTMLEFSPKDAEGKKKIAARLLPFLAKMGNRIEKDHWIHELAASIHVSEEAVRETLGQIPLRSSSQKYSLSRSDTPQRYGKVTLEDIFLAMALKYTEFLPYLIDKCDQRFFQEQETKELYKEMVIYYTTNYNASDDNKGEKKHYYESFYKHLLSHHDPKKEQLAQKSSVLFLLAEKDFFDYDSIRLKTELEKILGLFHVSYLQRRLQEIQVLIADAEHRQDLERVRELSAQFNQIAQELNLLSVS